jgi:hypothetical protein
MTRGFILRVAVAALAVPAGGQEAPPLGPGNLAFLDHVKNARTVRESKEAKLGL